MTWFESYLSNRFQRVVISGQTSQWMHVPAGVPQGSVLGPILFLVYINDIINNIQSDIFLFADDTSLLKTVDDPTLCAGIVNHDLHTLENWAKTWLVSFNPKKTESITFSTKTHSNYHPPLRFCDEVVKHVPSHTHLGLTQHITEMITKANKKVNLLSRLKFQLDYKVLKTIYISCIRPLLEYSDIVWDNCTEQESKSIEQIQNRCARFISGAMKGTANSKMLFEAGLESLSSRRDTHKLLLMHKIINQQTPRHLNSLLPITVNTRAKYPLRNSTDLSLIKCNTDRFQKSFFPSTVRLWNQHLTLPKHPLAQYLNPTWSNTQDQILQNTIELAKDIHAFYYLVSGWTSVP